MSPGVLLIHAERSRDALYRASLNSAEPALDVSFAETPDEVRSQPVPELILLDLDHTRPSSLETLKWLRSEQAYAQIPVIALTSSKASNRINRAYALGANSCIMKTWNGFSAEAARGIAGFAKILNGGHQSA